MADAEGTIVKIYGLFYIVERDGKRIHSFLRGKHRKNRDMRAYSNPFAVGDHVLFEMNADGTGSITEILPRKNTFSRKDKGKNKKEDIIASNLDLIVVIQSFHMPDLNLRFVDRLAVRGAKEGIPVLLCVNKLDLAPEGMKEYVLAYYAKAGVEIRMVSALTGEGMEEFRGCLRGNLSIFVGQSGVGKTSILNALCPGLNLRTSEISASTGKGRHATTNVEMIDLPGGGGIIDTPGMREFGLMDIEPHALGRYFPEFRRYLSRCAYNPCTHDHEPDCGVKRAVEKGRIFEDRYVSYLYLLASQREYYDRLYK